MVGWLYEFRNWVTAEEELDSYAEEFFNTYFWGLPRDVLSIIRQKVWSAELQKLLGGRRSTIPRGLCFFLRAHYEYLFLPKDS